MKLSGNTILITGGGSGIGLALAEEFKRLNNTVIVAGRSKEKLKAANEKGFETAVVDMTDAGSIRTLSTHLIENYPALNVVIPNAGVMMNEKFINHDISQTAQETVLTNLLGPILLTNALLPHLLTRPSATIITVSSGLAFVPLAMTPTYSATKAAIHSFTKSLRFQLKETSVEVKELVPPYVRTGLMGERQATDPSAMPLEDFISEVFRIFREQPEAQEILVKNVLPFRTLGDNGSPQYEEFFLKRNEMLFQLRKDEWDRI